MNEHAQITQERLTNILDYNQETGVFTQKTRTSRRVKVGDVAGTIRPDGYVIIRIDGRLHRAHRLAWLFMTGCLVEHQIDHIDRNPSNNAFANLRICNQSQNNQNTGLRSDNRSGAKGVVWDKSTKSWRSEIQTYGEKIWLGRHKNKADAILARRCSEQKHHEFCSLSHSRNPTTPDTDRGLLGSQKP